MDLHTLRCSSWWAVATLISYTHIHTLNGELGRARKVWGTNQQRSMGWTLKTGEKRGRTNAYYLCWERQLWLTFLLHQTANEKRKPWLFSFRTLKYLKPCSLWGKIELVGLSAGSFLPPCYSFPTTPNHGSCKELNQSLVQVRTIPRCLQLVPVDNSPWRTALR